MKRVTGLGGIFFKAEDPKKLNEWYKNHLGVTGVFKWYELHNPGAAHPAQTVWSTFEKQTTYFQPSEKQFMINYRVENLEELLEVLKREGVTVIGEVQTFSYGKFGYVLDPEGNKIELWQPIDGEFE
jgi:predicted enzyme related to lactoylglutathione lyase